jgi:HlyD family secretion protein
LDIPVLNSKKHSVFSLGKKPIFWVFVCGLALLTVPYFLSNALPSVDEGDIWVGQVKRGQMSREVRGVGLLAPADIRWVVSESNGRVERLLIKPGARVTKESVIAHIANPQLNRQLQQAKWDLDAARANMLAVKAQMEEQKLEQQLLVTEAKMVLESANMLQKAQFPLAQKSIISDIDFETTKLKTQQSEVLLKFRKQTQQRRLDVIDARLTAENAVMQKYQNIVHHVEAQVTELVIKAGINGVLQALSVQVGQQVEVGSTIAHVADPDSLLAELQVQQVQAKDIALDLLVAIDTRNGVVQGSVSRIDPRVFQGNVQVDVQIIGPLPQGARPDLSVTGVITIESIADTLFVERPTGSSPDSESKLYVVDTQQQIASQKWVKLGRASVNQVEVLSGLQEGDSVLISDTSAFRHYPKIRITQ